jgi:hypothetical protein
VTERNDQPEKTPAEQALEQALDVLVYAPIGLVFEGASLLPALVEKGKSQVTMARMVGQFAVTAGRGEATKRAGELREQAADLLARLAEVKLPGQTDAPVAAPAAPAPAPAPVDAPVTPPEAPAEPAGPVVEAGALAIPDYDGLSASHVVNRLAGLSTEELETVRSYELAHRGRKTILSKIAQLQSS